MNVIEKKCFNCDEVKDVKAFSKCSGRKDGLQGWCKLCVQIRDREKYKNPEVRQRYIDNNKKRQEYCREKLFEFLSTQECIDCHEGDPIVLEFDHRGHKEHNVSDMVRLGSWKNMLKEIAKCDIVCANCHKRRTAKQLGYYKYVMEENS